MIPVAISPRSPSPLKEECSSSDSEQDVKLIYDNYERRYCEIRIESRWPTEEFASAFNNLHKFVLLNPVFYDNFERLIWFDFRLFTQDYLCIKKKTWNSQDKGLRAVVAAIVLIVNAFPNFQNKYPYYRRVYFEELLFCYQNSIQLQRPDYIEQTYRTLQQFGKDFPEFSSLIPKSCYILSKP